MGLGRMKRLEHAIDLVGGEAGAVVGDGGHGLAVPAREVHAHPAPSRERFLRIAQEIAQGVGEQARVAIGRSARPPRTHDVRRPGQRLLRALRETADRRPPGAEWRGPRRHGSPRGTPGASFPHEWTAAAGRGPLPRADGPQEIEVDGEPGQGIAELVQEPSSHAAQGGQSLVLPRPTFGARRRSVTSRSERTRPCVAPSWTKRLALAASTRPPTESPPAHGTSALMGPWAFSADRTNESRGSSAAKMSARLRPTSSASASPSRSRARALASVKRPSASQSRARRRRCRERPRDSRGSSPGWR